MKEPHSSAVQRQQGDGCRPEQALYGPTAARRRKPNPDLAFHEGAALKLGAETTKDKKKKKDPVYARGAIKKASSKKKCDKDEFAKTQAELKEYHGMFYGTGLNPWD